MAQAQSRFTIVAVQNRGEFPFDAGQYDSEVFEFAPREVKHLTVDCARHLISHSSRRWNPITTHNEYVLAEVKPGEEASLISYEEAHREQLLDTSDMPPTHFDNDGKPMRGEVKNLGTPTGMLRGRIPAGANAGVPAARGAAGSGLGAKEALPKETQEAFDAGTQRLADELGLPSEG